jgi:hypothetical protein
MSLHKKDVPVLLLVKVRKEMDQMEMGERKKIFDKKRRHTI